MKKIIFICCFFFIGSVAAQTVRNMGAGVFADTLKSTEKTFKIKPDYSIGSKFTITAQTISGTDTLFVETASRDTLYYTPKILIDLNTGSPVSSIIITTTAKEYLIYDPQVYKIKLYTVNGLVSTKFTVSRK